MQLIILLASHKDWLKELINHSPAAIILLNFNCPPSEAEWIRHSGIVCVEIGAKQKKPLGINVCVDSKSAVQNMLRFLIQRGHREIGLLCANQELAIFQQYLESWHTTLLAHYMDPHLILHHAEPISFSTGAKLLNDALLVWGKVDVLVFLSDELACGALFEAMRKHLSVPNDLSIVGLGGLNVSAVSYPRLTTIAIPYEKLGAIAGQKLVESLQQDNFGEMESVIELPTVLIDRDSV